MKKKIAVVTASGIGDGLILHIASHNLSQMGYEVTTFNDHLPSFGQWLPHSSLTKQPPIHQIETLFAKYDAVILQHDNTLKARKVRTLNVPVYTLYGSHQISKHGLLRETDYVCHPGLNMVDHIHRALVQWFGAASKENGLVPLKGLIHRKYPHRVAIHPTSGSPEKNWPREKFDQVAQKLQQMGYDPVFLIGPGDTPLLPSLETLASFLYESGAFVGNDSGPGHIASYLQIPSLIIGKEAKQMKLWTPGWTLPQVITPPRWTSSWKWTRESWKKLITTRSVIKRLKYKVLEN